MKVSSPKSWPSQPNNFTTPPWQGLMQVPGKSEYRRVVKDFRTLTCDGTRAWLRKGMQDDCKGGPPVQCHLCRKYQAFRGEPLTGSDCQSSVLSALDWDDSISVAGFPLRPVCLLSKDPAEVIHRRRIRSTPQASPAVTSSNLQHHDHGGHHHDNPHHFHQNIASKIFETCQNSS